MPPRFPNPLVVSLTISRWQLMKRWDVGVPRIAKNAPCSGVKTAMRPNEKAKMTADVPQRTETIARVGFPECGGSIDKGRKWQFGTYAVRNG